MHKGAPIYLLNLVHHIYLEKVVYPCYDVKKVVRKVATEKPRFSLTISDDVLKEIEKYQAENRISTRNKAIQKLVEKGMAIAAEREQAVKKEKQPAAGGELSQVEVEFFNEFRKIPDSHKGLAASLCTALVRELVKHQTIEIRAEASVPVGSNR